jgi:hypothetical protein
MAEQNLLLSVMDAIENAGYNGVGGFLDALLVSQDGSMKRRVSTLVENQMPNIVINDRILPFLYQYREAGDGSFRPSWHLH